MYPPLQLLHPPDAADKADALVCFRVFDAKDRLQNLLLQNGHIEPQDGILLYKLRAHGESIPLVFEIHPDPALSLRTKSCIPLFNLKRPLQLFQELLPCQAVQIHDHPVVIHDRQFLTRKQHR